jgi:ORF6N domain
MTRETSTATGVDIASVISFVRGQRVIMDVDLAKIYGVATKRLNEQIKRNADRFPADFMFRLTAVELAELRAPAPAEGVARNRSQIATGPQKHRDPRLLPYAFTEHGALMAANVLNSARAVEMSVYVIRAFVSIRRELAQRQDLARRLAEIERTLIGHDTALRDPYAKIRALLLPPPSPSK